MLLYLFRELQSNTNYYMLSLALSDLVVCTLVMPCSAAVLISGDILDHINNTEP